MEQFWTNPNVLICLQALTTLAKKQTELLELQIKIATEVSNLEIPQQNIVEPPKMAEMNPVQFDYSQVQPRKMEPSIDYDPRKYVRPNHPSQVYRVMEQADMGYGDPGMEYRS